jgi:WD40 repeat protein
LSFIPSAPVMAANGSDETLHFWNTESGAVLMRLEDANNRPVMAFDPSGNLLSAYDAAAHRAALVEIQPSVIYQSVTPPNPVRSAVATGALDLNGSWLVSSAHGAVQLRDARSGKTVQTIPGVSVQDMMTAQFAPDGKALFVGSTQAGLSRLEITNGGKDQPVLGATQLLDGEPGFSIEGVADDGRVLLISEAKQIAKVLDPANPRAAVAWPVTKITSACFSPDGRQVLTEAGESIPGEAAVKVWDFPANALPNVVASFGDDPGGRVQCSHTGGWVLVTGDKKTELWRFGSWQHGPPLPIELQGELHHARLSPDGASLAIEKDHEIHLVATATGEPLATFSGTSNPGGICVNEVFSADGARLALLWQYGSVHTWDLAAMHRELRSLGLDWAAK